MNPPLRKVFVAGHRGMVGSAVCRRLAKDDVEVIVADRNSLDLRDESAVLAFLRDRRPDAIVFAAAKVGGIVANNSYPVAFLSENVQMAVSSINAAYEAGVERFLFLGSTCIYPRDCPQPIEETSLLTGPLEKTNEAYALAKIVGLKLCEYYRREREVRYHSAMPTNLYGPGDNYHPEHSHVLPALIRRFEDAKRAGDDAVTIWGSGTPRREFLYVEDLADAIVHLLGVDDPPDWVNVGTGTDLTILELARLVAETVGFRGRVETDPSRPDGTPIKCTNVARLHALGWRHRVELPEGLRRTYEAYLAESDAGLLRSV